MDIAVANTWMMCSTLVVGEFPSGVGFSDFKRIFRYAISCFDDQDTSFHYDIYPDYEWGASDHALFVATTIESQGDVVENLKKLGFKAVGTNRAGKTGNDVTLWFADVNHVLKILSEKEGE